MTSRSKSARIVVAASAVFHSLAWGHVAIAQTPKTPIVPPTVQGTKLPDLDLFAPSAKPGPDVKPTRPTPVPASAPISKNDVQPQMPRFSSTLPSALPVKKPEPPKAEPVVESPAGNRPAPLPPPVQRPEFAKPSAPDPEPEAPWAKSDVNAIYRPLAAVVMEDEAKRGAADNPWRGSPEALPLPKVTPVPAAVQGPSTLNTPVEEHFDDSPTWTGPDGPDRWLWAVPSSLLWQPALANPREPRMSAQYLRVERENTFDAVAGGEFGLFRISTDQRSEAGFQLDLFGVVLSRFHSGDLTALDYRAGVPLTWQNHCWQFKLAYEHTSSEIQGAADAAALDFRQEEVVGGLARRWGDMLRTYGQVGWTFSGTAAQKNEPLRFNGGVEWADLSCTTPSGSPFAALDLEWRGDQDYKTNATVQVGWSWRGRVPGRGPRIAGEYHTGYSPFGQFFLRREDWYGLTAALDW